MNTKDIFNQNAPFEKLVYERLEEHMWGNDSDYVLALLGRDFPFMSPELKAKCEKWVFEYYHTNAQGKTFAKLVWMTIGHSKDIDKPMDTQLTTSFHLNEGEDLYLAFQMENPLYGIGEAHVDYTVHLDCEEVGRVRRTMSVDEYRCVYYVPLNILKTGLLSEELNRETFNVLLLDNNVHATQRSKFIYVFYGTKGAKDVFSVSYCYLSNDYNEERTDFYLTDYDTLNFHASLEYNGHFGDISELQGTVTITPSDENEGVSSALCRVDIGADESKAGRMRVFARLVGKDNLPTNIHRPIYHFTLGKYIVRFYIWGELLCSREIEIFEEQDEFERFLEDFIRTKNAEND